MGRIFGYYKLECNDLDTIRETLTKEQGFDLICALVDYSRDGTITELPAELRIPFAMLKKKVDQAHKVYEDKCNTLKENGRKGGEAKAKNREQATGSVPAQAKKFKPPTLSQFKNAVKKIVDDNDFDDVEPYDIEKFHDELNESSWNFEGMAIQSRNDWEKIIHARFHDPLDYCYDGLRLSYLSILKGIIHAYPHLHHMWGEIDSKIEDLLDCWDSNCWKVNGNSYKQYDWKAALDALSEEQEEDDPP